MRKQINKQQQKNSNPDLLLQKKRIYFVWFRYQGHDSLIRYTIPSSYLQKELVYK